MQPKYPTAQRLAALAVAQLQRAQPQVAEQLEGQRLQVGQAVAQHQLAQ